MPKTRVRSKKTKNPLTRGRTRPKGDPDRHSGTTSDTNTEDTNSELQTSLESKCTETTESSRTSSTGTSPPPVKPPVKVDLTNSDDNADREPSWQDLPDLVTELRSSGTFTYITNDLRHREFELNARKELAQLYDEIDLLKDTCAASLKITKNLCPESKYGKVSDAIKAVGFPTSFKDLVLKLVNLPTPSGFSNVGRTVPKINIPEPLFEESEEELDNKFVTPFAGKVYTNPTVFPSPSKMVNKYVTPKQRDGVFHFGTRGTHATGLSTSKAPRLAKPGEVVYSEGGSPILQRRIIEDAGVSSKLQERVEFIDTNGSKVEYDLVYRGVPDPDKLRGFKEFAKDVRGIAASRSTVKQNRVQQPRIIGTSLSATKKKPEWR